MNPSILKKSNFSPSEPPKKGVNLSTVDFPSSKERNFIQKFKGNTPLHLLANNSSSDVNQRLNFFQQITGSNILYFEHFNQKWFQPYTVFRDTWTFVIGLQLPSLDELKNEVASLPYDDLNESYAAFVSELMNLIAKNRSNTIQQISIHLFDYFENKFHLKRKFELGELEGAITLESTQSYRQLRLTMSMVDRKKIEGILMQTIFCLLYTRIQPSTAWEYLFSLLNTKFNVVEEILSSMSKFVDDEEIFDNLDMMKFLHPKTLVQRNSVSISSYLDAIKSQLPHGLIERVNQFFDSSSNSADFLESLKEDFENQFYPLLEPESEFNIHLQTFLLQQEEQKLVSKYSNRCQLSRIQWKSDLLSLLSGLGQRQSQSLAKVLEKFIYEKRNYLFLQMNSLKNSFTFASYYNDIVKEVTEISSKPSVSSEKLIAFILYILFQEMYCFQLLSWHLLGLNYWHLPHLKRFGDNSRSNEDTRRMEGIVPRNDYEYAIELIEFFIISTIKTADPKDEEQKRLYLMYWPEFLTRTSRQGIVLNVATADETSKGTSSSNFPEERRPKLMESPPSIEAILLYEIEQRLLLTLENLGRNFYQIGPAAIFPSIIVPFFQTEMKYYASAKDLSPDKGGSKFVNFSSSSIGSDDKTKEIAIHELTKTEIRQLMFQYVMHNHYDSSLFTTLTEVNFQRFQQFAKKYIENEWDYLFVLYALTIHDLGRTETVRKIVDLEDEKLHDQYKVVREFVKYCLDRNDSSLLPFLFHFPENYQTDFLQQLLCPFNLGQLVQGENLPFNLSEFFIMIPNEKLQGIQLLIGLISFCVMRLQANVFNTEFENYMKAIELILLTRPTAEDTGVVLLKNVKVFQETRASTSTMSVSVQKRSLMIYRRYLDFRCQQFNYTGNDYAMQRLLVLSRATQTDGVKKLQSILNILPLFSEKDQNDLLSELSRTGFETSGGPAILIYYFPAIIGNAIDLERSIDSDKPIEIGLFRALKEIIKLYQTTRLELEKAASREPVFTAYAIELANNMKKPSNA